jgi:ligand-binding sensor domain-containing protein
MGRIIWLWFWVLTTFIINCFPLFSQEYDLRFTHLSVQDGLSENAVTSIFQDRDGFLWLGTHDGLNKYDGYNFTIYNHEPNDPSSLSSNIIHTIYQDRSGVLWIGTDRGLNRFNTHTGTFIRFLHDPGNPKSLDDNFVRVIYEDSQGMLWVSNNRGLDQLDRANNTFIHFRPEANNKKSLSHHMVNAMYEDRDGVLWIGTMGGGLNTFNRENGEFSHFLHDEADPNSLSNNHIGAICESNTGSLLIVTFDGCINTYDKDSNKIVRLDIGLPKHLLWPPEEDLSIILDREGYLWIGTYGKGIIKYNFNKNTYKRYQYDSFGKDKLSHNRINCIYRDRSNILWIGTEGGGLNKFIGEKEKFYHYRHEPGNPKSLSYNFVHPIYEDRHGTIWIGTGGKGLDKLDPDTGHFYNYRHISGNSNSLSHDYVRSIREDPQHGEILWIATEGGGLNRFNTLKGTFKAYRHDPEDPNSLSHDRISSALVDKDGILWLGTDKGLDKFHRDKEIFTHYLFRPDFFKNNKVFLVFEGRSGYLWLGTWGFGLFKFDKESGVFTPYSNEPNNKNSLSHDIVSVIFEDSQERFWVGTYGGGLNKFDKKTGTFRHYTKREGLVNNVVYGILEDSSGSLWISTNKGLCSFNPETENFRSFDVKDGLQSNEFNSGSYCLARDGRMYFGGINGINVFYPEKIRDNPYVPPVVLTSFRIFDQERKLGDDITKDKEVILSYQQNFITFEFAALDFTRPEKNMYAFKLEGLDKKWNFTPSQRRFANYTDLDPGEYTFRVKGSNNDGIWNEIGAHLNIIITPPFWQTWWFRLLGLLGFAGFSYFVIQMSKKYLRLITFWRKRNYVGHYKIVEKIAVGGMGTVYKVYNILTKSGLYALKLMNEELSKDDTQKRRFKHEAVIIDQLDHPNIVKIVERGEQDSQLYIVMEYLDGKTLAELIEEQGMMTFFLSLKIMLQITDALVQIHKKDIIHRDLKPENIMLIKKDGHRHHVKLLDFGIAKAQTLTRLTESGVFIGTFMYLSPEQLSHYKVTVASDIFSLGIIFYEILTGNHPFYGDTSVEIMRKILGREPEDIFKIRPALPHEIGELIMRMLNKAPEKRPTAGEILKALKPFYLIFRKEEEKKYQGQTEKL